MTVAPVTFKIAPDASLRRQVEGLSGQKVTACFQCQKCTNGCPLTFAMDIPPHQLIRYVHLGLEDKVLTSKTIWVCASCQTCNTRCPNNIDIAHIMDTLRQLSQRKGIAPAIKNVPTFHKAFLASVKRHGRIHELEMATDYTLKSGGLPALAKQAGMGLAMFKRGKIKVLPAKVRGKKQIKGIFRQTEGKK